MKAIIATGSDHLTLDPAHVIPTVNDGEVLVKIAATPLQPSDRLNVKGDFPATEFPIIPGRNYAGTVVAPESSTWFGKRVYGTSGHELSFNRNGTHTEYVVVPEYGLTEIPNNWNWVQTALMRLPWTAWLTLNRARATKGVTVAVLGTGGDIGSAIVEIAGSSPFEFQVLRVERGAKYNVDITSDSSLNGLTQKTNGKRPDIVIDTTSDSHVSATAIKVLGKKGRLAFHLHQIEPREFRHQVKSRLQRLIPTRAKRHRPHHDMAETTSWMSVLSQGLESGQFTPPNPDDPRVKIIKLDDTIETYWQLEGGSQDLVVIVNE